MLSEALPSPLLHSSLLLLYSALCSASLCSALPSLGWSLPCLCSVQPLLCSSLAMLYSALDLFSSAMSLLSPSSSALCPHMLSRHPCHPITRLSRRPCDPRNHVISAPTCMHTMYSSTHTQGMALMHTHILAPRHPYSMHYCMHYIEICTPPPAHHHALH